MDSGIWSVLYPIPRPTASVAPIMMSAPTLPDSIPVPVQAEWYLDLEGCVCDCQVMKLFFNFPSILPSNQCLVQQISIVE